MKKIVYLIALIIGAFTVACDPIVDNVGVGDVITSADQIEATVTPVMIGSYNTNKVKVHCTSPVICQWSGGPTVYVSNDTTVLLFVKGEQDIILTAMANDGTTYTKSYTVTVDSMYYDVPEEWGYFCGTSDKTWVWATDNTYSSSQWIWGNGDRSSDTAPAWWGRSASDAAEDDIDIDGTMNFSLDGATFTKVEDGDTTSGKFSFDMTASTTTQGIGTLTISGGTTILHGISQNDSQATVYTFDIIKLTDDELILEYSTESNTYEGWFWVFKREGYTY